MHDPTPQGRTADRARRLLGLVVAAALLSSASWSAAASFLEHFTTARVSVSSAGGEGNASSTEPAVSADGRHVAFTSAASNLVPDDSNGMNDVFVRDLVSKTTTRVSVSTAGVEGSAMSSEPAVSADGRYVAFVSGASNLVPGDTNGMDDVFVRDRASGETTRVSVSTAGDEGSGSSSAPAISADGRYVAFTSRASNLVPGDANGMQDVFVRDLASGKTTRVSFPSAGGAGSSGGGSQPALSADGRYVAFSSSSDFTPGDTNGMSDIYVRDRASGETTCASVSTAGGEGDYSSTYPALSADGRYVAFHSGASNLVPGDTNGVFDVFVHDLASRETTRASVSSTGAQSDKASHGPAVSANGRYVVFHSGASNLAPGDTIGVEHVYMRDLASAETTRVSVSTDGEVSYWGGFLPAVSADGGYVAFVSWDSNLVPGDTNGSQDIFVRGRMKAESSISLTSPSKTLRVYGAFYTLAGTLTSNGGALAGRRIALQTALSAAGPWTTSAVGSTTTASGAFSLRHTPRTKTYYRAMFEGQPFEYAASVSAVRRVVPRAWVGDPRAPATMYARRAGTVYGYLKPRHRARTYPVRIYRYRLVGRKWKSYGYVKARAYDRSTYTRYSASVRLPYRGKWRLRAYHPADAGHAATLSSRYDYVTVR